jgi:catechol 2,3-dioxygenase-like lactoylglutathione lyase family enzyme
VAVGKQPSVVDTGRPLRFNDLVSDAARPLLRSIVLDTTDPLRLADFYHCLLGYPYRADFEPSAGGPGDEVDWILLESPGDGPYLAFQKVAVLPAPTWPTTAVPQQLHLDLTVPDKDVLEEQHRRALDLGARLLLDGSDDPEEPIYIYADPDGHPFCIFVIAPPP